MSTTATEMIEYSIDRDALVWFLKRHFENLVMNAWTQRGRSMLVLSMKYLDRPAKKVAYRDFEVRAVHATDATLTLKGAMYPAPLTGRRARIEPGVLRIEIATNRHPSVQVAFEQDEG